MVTLEGDHPGGAYVCYPESSLTLPHVSGIREVIIKKADGSSANFDDEFRETFERPLMSGTIQFSGSKIGVLGGTYQDSTKDPGVVPQPGRVARVFAALARKCCR